MKKVVAFDTLAIKVGNREVEVKTGVTSFDVSGKRVIFSSDELEFSRKPVYYEEDFDEEISEDEYRFPNKD